MQSEEVSEALGSVEKRSTYLADKLIRLVIDRCSCLVEKKEAIPLEDGSGHAEELTLALREVGSALSHITVEVVER